MADHIDLGKRGEDLATDYLAKKGFEIVARNYTFRRSEIDIVSRKNGLLVVVEVKTRASRFMAGPHQTISKNKQKAIIRAANYYIRNKALDCETRFDVVSVILNNKYQHIEHIEDAFYPVL